MARRPSVETDTGFVRLRFNASNPKAEQAIADQGGRLVTRITDDTRRALMETIEAGYAKGLGPREIALDIAGRVNAKGVREGGIIGLTAPQANAALNLRDRLSSNSPSEMRKVLQMKMRDARFDAQILKSIKSGEALSVDKINQMYDRYVSNALRLRAETIARTETAQAVMSASRQSFIQGLEKAGVSEDAVERVWDSAGDERTRDTHAEMDGQIVNGLEEPFVSPSGAEMLFPMDASLGAPPEEIISCRCEVQYNIDYSAGLELLPDELDEPPQDGGEFDEQVGLGGLDLTDSVIKLLNEAPAGRSIDDMAKELLNQFPDRTVAKIKASISSLFSRPPKSLTVKFVKGAGGRYRIDGTPPPVPPVTPPAPPPIPPVRPPVVPPVRPPVPTPPVRPPVTPPAPPPPPVPPVRPPVVPPVAPPTGGLTEQFLSIVTSGVPRTVDEIADLIKPSFPDRDIDAIRNSIRSLMSRLPKQGKLILTKERGGKISGRIPQGGIPGAVPPPAPVPPVQLPPPIELGRPPVPPLTGPWVPRYDSRNWTNYSQAVQEFKANHGFNARAYTGGDGGKKYLTYVTENEPSDARDGLARLKEVDRALNDLKDRFPGLRDEAVSSIAGGLEIKVDYAPGNNALGLHYTYQLRMQLAGKQLSVTEKPTSHWREANRNGAEFLVSPNKWTVADSSIASVFRHEYGHALEREIYKVLVKEDYAATGPSRYGKVKIADKDIVAWEFVAAGDFAASKSRQVIQATRYWLDSLNRDPKTIKPSQYGGSNGAELWAESFAAYTHPAFKPNSGMIDPRLERMMDKILKPNRETATPPVRINLSAPDLAAQSRALAARGEPTLIGSVRPAEGRVRPLNEGGGRWPDTYTAVGPNGARAPGFKTEKEAWEYLARLYLMDNRGPY